MTRQKRGKGKMTKMSENNANICQGFFELIKITESEEISDLNSIT